MVEGFRLEKKYQENIFKTLDQVGSKFREIGLESVLDFKDDPLEFFMHSGLDEEVYNWIIKFEENYQGFQQSFKRFATKILKRLTQGIKDCDICKMEVMFMAWVVRSALRNSSRSYAELEEAFLNLFMNSPLFAGTTILGGALTDFIARRIGIDWRPHKLAQLVCYKLGICPHPNSG
jgi:hypothetical protein